MMLAHRRHPLLQIRMIDLDPVIQNPHPNAPPTNAPRRIVKITPDRRRIRQQGGVRQSRVNPNTIRMRRPHRPLIRKHWVIWNQ